MTNFKHYAIAALMAGALALPVAGAANAATKSSSPQSFKSLDTDKSGSLNEAEYTKDKMAPVPFSQADADGDGKVTQSEFQTASAESSTPSPSTESKPTGTMN